MTVRFYTGRRITSSVIQPVCKSSGEGTQLRTCYRRRNENVTLAGNLNASCSGWHCSAGGCMLGPDFKTPPRDGRR